MNAWLRQTMVGAAMAGAVAVFAAGTAARAQLRTPTTSSHGTTITVVTSNEEDDATTRDADKAAKDKADVDADKQAAEVERAKAGADRAAQRALERAHAQMAAEGDRMRELENKLKTARAFTVAMPGGKKEKVAFLGVVTTPATAELRENLGLQRGVGLVVQMVEDDSAAGKAGLVRYDILQKLDDQLLCNSQQLGVLVRLHKAGDKVTLTVLRKGKEQKLDATLTEKETFVSDSGEQIDWMPGNFQLNGVGAVGFGGNGNMAAAVAPVPPVPPVAPRAEWIRKVEPMRARVQNSTANIIHTDDQMTLELTVKDGTRHLKAKDKDGKLLFDGDINTDAQRKDVPAEVATRLEKLEKNAMIIPDVQTGDVAVRLQGAPE